jgi:valyl-tRNA synthetase
MKPLPQQYQHKETEKRLQKQWAESGVYHWNNNVTRDKNFVIDTPPPTVSGVLHMGHIYSYTQADFVARYMRMKGKNVFYPMGFDDNGLPTERLVEKIKKVRAADLSREDFIRLCEEVAAEARVEFKRLFESVALSVDWNQIYSTISYESRRISQMSFLDLFHKGQAYRKLQPMLWDPVDQTAIAQAEIEDKEVPSKMRDIKFTCMETGEDIIIATTRPELLGACVAVFYHPEDSRYSHLKNKTAITALFGVKVPLLADENVKIEKGTGLVMCCTFGDETDINWWRTHKLPTRLLLDKYGKIRSRINDHALHFITDEEQATLTDKNCISLVKAKETFQALEGLKVVNAREKILELLKNENVILKEQDITHAVKCAERSGAALEILPTNQWFVKVLEHKEALKEKAKECNWNPDYMRIRIEQWIDGLSWDWCISRQRYFGVPFPIWYSKRAGEEGKVLVASPDQLPVNPLVDLPKGYTKEEVIPEADVMDTWATSSVSPQLNSHAINKDYAVDFERHQKLFPADLRPQAHEIIRTWAFYTIVKAHLHENTIPWKNLMISGWCLAADKTKMSKSKGNVITPVELIEEKSADVVRFWASTSRLGADTAYSEDVLKVGKKLVNKLWNATRFAALHLEKLKVEPVSAIDDIKKGIIQQPLDIWVLSQLHDAIAKATKEFERYEYCNAREAAEGFFWNDFCDNYLELVKVRVYGEAQDITEAEQNSAIHTIYHCLDGILKLFAPIVPHITEELYLHIFDKKAAHSGNSIHTQGMWPNANTYPSDKRTQEYGVACINILNVIRKIKAEQNVSIKTPLEWIVISYTENNKDFSLPEGILKDLRYVTNANAIYLKEPSAGDNIFTGITEDKQLKIATVFGTITEENIAQG